MLKRSRFGRGALLSDAENLSENGLPNTDQEVFPSNERPMLPDFRTSR